MLKIEFRTDTDAFSGGNQIVECIRVLQECERKLDEGWKRANLHDSEGGFVGELIYKPAVTEPPWTRPCDRQCEAWPRFLKSIHRRAHSVTIEEWLMYREGYAQKSKECLNQFSGIEKIEQTNPLAGA